MSKSTTKYVHFIVWTFKKSSSNSKKNDQKLAARIGGVQSTQFLLTIDGVVIASNSRDVVSIIIRNDPHTSRPNGPSWGLRCSIGQTNGQGQHKQLKIVKLFSFSLDDIKQTDTFTHNSLRLYFIFAVHCSANKHLHFN